MPLDNEFYKKLLDNLYDGVYFVDKDRKITYWNQGAERITGYKSEEVVGKHCHDNILVHIDEQGKSLCLTGCPLSETMQKGNTCESEIYLHHKDGHRVPVLVKAASIKDENNQSIGAVEIFSDNTTKMSRLQKIKELEKLAYIDSLTEMPNRRYTEINLYARYNEMKRYGLAFGLIMIDIDHFKKVNDTYGHDVGDEVLKMVSKTLLDNARPYDIVGRWGGEEFLAIVVNITKEELYVTANRLRILVEQSMLTTTKNIIRVTISLGATLAQPADTTAKLIKRVDKLLYQAKSSGRNAVSMDM